MTRLCEWWDYFLSDQPKHQILGRNQQMLRSHSPSCRSSTRFLFVCLFEGPVLLCDSISFAVKCPSAFITFPLQFCPLSYTYVHIHKTSTTTTKYTYTRSRPHVNKDGSASCFLLHCTESSAEPLLCFSKIINAADR